MIFAQLQNWLQKNIPEVVADLNPGSTNEALENFSTILGQEIPDDFANLYRWRNGQKEKVAVGVFYGLPFLPLEKVIEQWRIWSEVTDGLSENALRGLNEGSKSAKPQTIKPLYANKLWIPFAHDGGGNHLGIDLDPDTQGTCGQVINFGRDEDTKYVIAPSISSFLEWMLRELNARNYNIKTEGNGDRSFNTLRPKTSHFLDSLKDLFDKH